MNEKLQRWLEYSKQFPTSGKASLAIVERGGSLLSISRENDLEDWTLPGGKLEPGENWLAALVREVREETGTEIISASLVYEGESDDKHYVRVYTCKLEEYPSLFAKNPEGVVKWVKPEQLVEGCFRGFNMRALSAAGIQLQPLPALL